MAMQVPDAGAAEFGIPGGELMARHIEFIILGEPVSKARPVVTSKFTDDGKRITFTPKKTKKAESDFRLQAFKFKPDKPFTGQIYLFLRFYRSIPKSFSKRKTSQAITGAIRPTTKPDLDNMAKLVKDVMRSIFYVDDNQVVRLDAEKWYSDRPRIEITIDAPDYHGS